MLTEKTHRFNQTTRRIQLVEQSPVFSELILQCIREESSRRPSSFEVEHLLHKYQRAADRYIREKDPNYSKQSVTGKDAILVRFYNEYHQQEKVEPKAVFPSPPKSHANIELIRQHFDDMMKQLRSVEEKQDHRLADRSVLKKLDKYLDEPKLMRRERRPSAPGANDQRIRQENHHEFLRVVHHERSRTPTPLSPRLRAFDADNEFEERMQRLRLEAGFEQRSPLFPRILRPFK